MAYTFNHIHLRSPDIEATAAWYQRMFDAELTRTTANNLPRIDVSFGGVRILISPATPEVNPAAVVPCQGIDHFAFAVTGIDAVFADLKRRGAEFTREITQLAPNLRVCFLRAPEGVSIEVLERT